MKVKLHVFVSVVGFRENDPKASNKAKKKKFRNLPQPNISVSVVYNIKQQYYMGGICTISYHFQKYHSLLLINYPILCIVLRTDPKYMLVSIQLCVF